jgi:hypothetical protein
MLSLIFKLVVQQSSTMQMCQRQCLGSRHPRRMTLPSKVTSQLVALKNTLQPALQRTATDRRLLVRPGRLWAMRAFDGSLLSRRSTVWVVLIMSPPGWMTVMDSRLVAGEVHVDGVTRDLEAAVLIKAVEDKLGGLVQPE